MGIKKADKFWSFIRGESGSFIRTLPVKGEQGLIDVEYRPENSFFGRAIVKSIPEEAIFRFAIGENSMTIVTENSKGDSEVLNNVQTKLIRLNTEMREKLINEKFKSRAYQHKAGETERSLDRQAKKKQERSGRGRFGGHDGSVGGYRSGFGERRDDVLDNW